MPAWFTAMLEEPNIDLAASGGYSNESPATLLAGFDKAVARTREAFARTGDDTFAEQWSLVRGDMVLYTASREDAVRQTINHLVHHRAQLTVYLRLLDVAVPAIYGPSADERGF